jgi:hypothetical protein
MAMSRWSSGKRRHGERAAAAAAAMRSYFSGLVGWTLSDHNWWRIKITTKSRQA